jgi:hypothetical protein
MRRTIGIAVVAGMVVISGALTMGTLPAGAAGGGPASQATASGGAQGGQRGAADRHHGAVAQAAPATSGGGGASGRTVVPGAWSINPSGNASTSNGLFTDACVTSTFCMAVGASYGGTYNQTLIEQWNGTTWSVVPSPDVSATTDEWLNGVSCVTTVSCVAVGYSDGGSKDQTLVETWNGTAWSIQTSPDPSSSLNYELYAVSCTSQAFCTAAGETWVSGSPSVYQTFAMQWNGTTWTVPSTPSPSATDSYFNSVTCKSASFCLGVGSTKVGSGPVYDTLIEQWNGSSWTVVGSPTPPGNGGYLDAVSCPSASFCVAVGYTDATVSQTLIEQWNGSTWSIVPSPNTAGSFSDELWAVSCVGPTSCTTVGYSYTSGSPPYYWVTEALNWNGATWSLQPPANPAVNTPGNNRAELYGVSCIGGQSCVAVGDAYPGSGTNDQTLAESAPITRPGYRFVAGDGGVFAFGGASFDGSAGSLHLNKPVVGMAATPDGGGYWLVASDGGIFSYGDAQFYGSTGSLTLNKPIVGMASTPDGDGYWLVASDGGIFSYGDATFFGSTGSLRLNKPMVGMAATPSGQGYWLVASDGGVFSYGDATFHGSTGSLTLNKPVVGMASTPSGNGYWLVASDGGIFSYGDATFHGSTGSLTLNKPVVGMASTPSGLGYWLVAADGGVFSYGDAVFSGSTGSLKLNSPIVGMSA